MRSSVTDAGSSRRWRKIRMATIRRAGFVCARCLMKLPASGLEVHHRRGRSLGDGKANLQCLCRECHSILEGRI